MNDIFENDFTDRLDGIRKKKGSTTIKEWLEEEGKNSDLTWYKSTKRDTGKKTVRNITCNARFIYFIPLIYLLNSDY